MNPIHRLFGRNCLHTMDRYHTLSGMPVRKIAHTARVTLVQHTANPEELVASAAKLCYAAETDTILKQEKTKARSFVKMLRGMGHESPLEHVSFTFYIEGISRAASHQLVRHRLASYSQRSQRYVKHRDFDFVMPPSLQGKMVTLPDGTVMKAERYYRETMQEIADRYGTLVQALGDAGESSNQDARYILPNACETKIFVTMNARALTNFFAERLCERAQWEIRAMAEKMLKLVKKKCPSLFSGIGPKCVMRGKCPEGVKTCGKFREKQAAYK